MKFEDLCSRYGIEIRHAGEHHHARPGWTQLDCPFCSKGSGRYRLGWNNTHSYFTCWTCGPHRVMDTLVALTGESWRKLRSIVGEIEKDRSRVETKDVRGKVNIPNGIGPLMKQHINYLSEQGFNSKEIRELRELWHLQGIGIHPTHPWRIFIPIEFDDEIVSWTTRSIGDARMRYMSASPEEEKFSMKSLLYGEDLVPGNTIIIVEGPKDAWRIGPGAVATLGVQYSTAQFYRMTKYMNRIICFDSDKEGQRQATKLMNDLMVFPGNTFSIALDASDPGSADKREIKLLREMLY